MTTSVHVPRSQRSARSHPRQAMRRRASRFLLTVACSAAVAACGDLTAPESAPGNPPAGPAARLDSSDPALSAQGATNIQFGDFALHVPANVNHVRGILVALGGPNTRGFALGTPFGAPPAVEASFQELGAMFRDLAAERGLAILGSGRFGPTAYPNEPASDQLLLDAMRP